MQHTARAGSIPALCKNSGTDAIRTAVAKRCVVLYVRSTRLYRYYTFTILRNCLKINTHDVNFQMYPNQSAEHIQISLPATQT